MSVVLLLLLLLLLSIVFTTWPSFDKKVDSAHQLLSTEIFGEIFHAVGVRVVVRVYRIQYATPR